MNCSTAAEKESGVLRERVRLSMRGKHCGGCGIQTGFDRRGEFRERSQERALQVSRERLGDGVVIPGGGREGGGKDSIFSTTKSEGG